MNTLQIARILELQVREGTARKRLCKVYELLRNLKIACDHRVEGTLAVKKQRGQRICLICGEAVVGRKNISVYNSFGGLNSK